MFDGHGGRAAADYAASHLHDAILREVHGTSGSGQGEQPSDESEETGESGEFAGVGAAGAAGAAVGGEDPEMVGTDE